jgi:hypothetical protein
VNASKIASAKEVLKVFSEESRMRARAIVMMGKFIVVTPLRICFFSRIMRITLSWERVKRRCTQNVSTVYTCS